MSHSTPNRILGALPDNIRKQVAAHCEPVDLALGSTLSRAGTELNNVHFPETAVISTVSSFSDGSMIEVANIGREGCTGIAIALGGGRELNTNVVQIEGRALEMDATDFRQLLSSVPAFQGAVFSAVRGLFQQVMISGACNATHSARARLARWLLSMRDRSPTDQDMKLTQDFLAEILGVRRATVSGAAAELREEGLIDYERGRISIIDLDGLRDASCECYDLVRRSYEALLPYSTEH